MRITQRGFIIPLMIGIVALLGIGAYVYNRHLGSESKDIGSIKKIDIVSSEKKPLAQSVFLSEDADLKDKLLESQNKSMHIVGCFSDIAHSYTSEQLKTSELAGHYLLKETMSNCIKKSVDTENSFNNLLDAKISTMRDNLKYINDEDVDFAKTILDSWLKYKNYLTSLTTKFNTYLVELNSSSNTPQNKVTDSIIKDFDNTILESYPEKSIDMFSKAESVRLEAPYLDQSPDVRDSLKKLLEV